MADDPLYSGRGGVPPLHTPVPPCGAVAEIFSERGTGRVESGVADDVTCLGMFGDHLDHWELGVRWGGVDTTRGGKKLKIFGGEKMKRKKSSPCVILHMKKNEELVLTLSRANMGVTAWNIGIHEQLGQRLNGQQLVHVNMASDQTDGTPNNGCLLDTTRTRKPGLRLSPPTLSTDVLDKEKEGQSPPLA
ncbi:hypothetical protein Btru_076871 [Bulinus truncatus]|nr:hypothetical protein Btru_076871 [Bulinus truncatus]